MVDKIKWYPIPCTRCGKEAGEVSNRFNGQITQALCPECVAGSLEGKTELTRLREVEKWAQKVAKLLIQIKRESIFAEAKTLGLLEDK